MVYVKAVYYQNRLNVHIKCADYTLYIQKGFRLTFLKSYNQLLFIETDSTKERF